MKTQDHSITTSWGGRVGRYQLSTGELHSAHDPFAVAPVYFSQAFHYEAWVLARFNAETATLTNQQTTVAATINGIEVRAQATFVVTKRDGSVHYVLCSKHGTKPAGYSTLVRIAKANGAHVDLLARQDVRAQVGQFWNFELLRQCTTIHERLGADLDERLLQAIDEGARKVEELACHIDQHNEALVRARLAHLHVSGRAVIEFSGSQLTAFPTEGKQQ